MTFRLKPESVFIDMDGITINDSPDGQFRVNGQIVNISTYCSYMAEFFRDQLEVEKLKMTRIQNEVDFLSRKVGFYESQIYINAGK